MKRRRLSWVEQAALVFRKDLLIELSTGEVITTSAFFAVLVVITASLSFYGGPETKKLVASGVIWLSVAFATVLSLGRTWQRERDEDALGGLFVSPLSSSAIFAGKMAGVVVFLLVVELVVIPCAAMFFSLELGELAPGLFLIALAATPGLAASGTLFGVMTVRTQARDLVLAIVLFPLLGPTLLAAVSATRELLGGAGIAELADYLKIMAAFDVVFVAGGLSMFGLLIDR